MFKTFTFFLEPNEPKSRLYRIKADAFVRNGAAIATDMTSQVTHILMGKEAVRSRNGASGPAGCEGAVVLRDSWASDSIEGGALMGTGAYVVVPDTSPETTERNKEDRLDQGPQNARESNGRDTGAISGAVGRGRSTPGTIERKSALESPLVRRSLTAGPKRLSPNDPGVPSWSQVVSEAKIEAIDQTRMEQPGPDRDRDPISVAANVSPATPRFKRRKVDPSKFLCAQVPRNIPKNPNAPTMAVLDSMMKQYELAGDEWRTQSYRKAISVLRRQTVLIATAAQAKKIHGIGTSLAEKIEEIVRTGHLQKLDDIQDDDQLRVISTLVKIHGVGTKTAKKWYAEGTRTLEDARNRSDLTETQQCGIDHYTDFNTRIPRHVITVHYELIQRALAHVDAAATCHIMGSYRRGKPDCGDIDIAITKPDAGIKDLEALMAKVVLQLESIGYIQCSLTAFPGSNRTKWMGAAVIPGDPVWRRVDLLMIPLAELGAASIYYTGNDLFNRSLRLLANKLGYRLNEHGLYLDPFPWRIKADLAVTYSQSDLVAAQDERRIFDILGVPYIDPTDRNVG